MNEKKQRQSGILKQLIARATNIQTLLGFSISFYLLGFTIKKSGIMLSTVKLSCTGWLYFTESMIMLLVAVWLYSLRTRLIWHSRNKTRGTLATYASIAIGNFYNCVLPANLGEGIRAWHFGRKNGLSFLQSLSTVITEKWIDGLLFIFLTAGLMLTGIIIKHYITYTLIAVATTAAIVWVLHTIMRKNKTVEKMLWITVFFINKKSGKWLHRLYSYNSRNVQGLFKNKVMSRYILLCFIILLTNMGQFILVMYAAEVPIELITPYSGFFMAAAMMIVAFIPSAPGNLGVLHYGVYETLNLLSTQYNILLTPEIKESFARFGIYLHLSYVVPEILTGLAVIVKERNSLFDFFKPNHKTSL